MSERLETNHSGTETKEITEFDKNILEQVLNVWGSIWDGICWPVAYKTGRNSEVDPRWLRQKIINFVNWNHKLLTKYGIGDSKDYSYDIFSDFQTYLTKLFEIFKDYGEFDWLTGDYKRSPMVRKLVEWMLELNGKFYDAYSDLKKSGFSEKLDQVKHLWMIVYRPLIQLVNKEIDALLVNQDEEAFKAWLKQSYIWEQIKWLKYGENFSESYSLLKEKQQELLNQLSELEECFDESGNLKKEAKIPDLHGLEIILDDKPEADKEELRVGVREKITKCLGWLKKVRRV